MIFGLFKYNFVKKTILWYFKYGKIIKTYLQNKPNKTKMIKQNKQNKTDQTKQKKTKLEQTKIKLNETNKNKDSK